MSANHRFCPTCANPLEWLGRLEDGGAKERLCCTSCGWTHWNNPVPVLGAIVEWQGRILLARNAAWSGRRFALITGFMEAGESPEEGISRELMEETQLSVKELSLVGVYDHQRMNQVLIVYHAHAEGTEVKLSPELAEYKLYKPEDIICWPSGTGRGVADWQRRRGIEPRFMDWAERERLNIE
ncbi:MAG: NUDIX hydrolase [Alphaproteobacteria bacterium]|nr:NUDIX hydrolase [Alphaproteobacteria bacterium]